MKNEYMNKIAKEAQEKFELAKQLILEEMQDAMNEIDQCSDECECQRILEAFADEYEDCCCCQKCMGDEDVDWDSDYREISVLVDGDNVAIEFDNDLDEQFVVANLRKALCKVIWAGVDARQDNDGKVLSEKEISDVIEDHIDNALIALSMKAIENAIVNVIEKKIGGDDDA